MNFYLPTREECQKIVEKSEAFYCTQTIVEGCNVEMYDYRLASHSDFIDNNAYELRGITFVEQPNGSWERFILMNKFFNVNQTSMPDLYEIELDDGNILKVNEEHKFHLKNGKTKFAKDLTEKDEIDSWDVLTEIQ